MSYPTPTRFDDETHCHCGCPYRGSDHCPDCGCEQYEGGCDSHYQPEVSSEQAIQVSIFRPGQQHAGATITGLDAQAIHMALASMFGHHTVVDWATLCNVVPASVTCASGHRVHLDPRES